MAANLCCQDRCALDASAGSTLPFERHESAGTFFSKLVDTSDFPARWYCGTWNAELGWLHIISDFAIFGAYTAIPLTIAYFILRRKDVPFPAILWLFVGFIMFCGLGHLVEAMIFWFPVYRLSGLVKGLTAAISWITVLILWRIMPKILELPRIAALNAELRHEIEARKTAQAEIAKLSLVASKSRHGVVITNLQGKIEWINEGFTSLTGYGLEDVLGKTLDEYLHGANTHPDTIRMIGERLADKERVNIEIVSCAKDGREYWMALEIEPVFDDAGEFLQFVGTQVDITERKRIDQALRRSNARFEALLKSDLLGIVVARTDGAIVSANDEFLNITGYARSDLDRQGLNWLTLTAPEFQDVAQKAVQELQTLGSARPWRNEYIRKDNERAPVLVGTTALPEDPGLCLGFVLDMTQQQAIERKLEHARRHAEYANEAKSSFLANMSHEIRTPLNSIIGFTELLASDEVLEEEKREHYATILNSSHHLLMLINDILDLSKVEAGRIDFDLAWCSPQSVVAEVASVLRVRAQEKQLQLECCWEGTVPEQIQTDPLRLRQLLVNLTGNAIKFTQSGLVRIRTSFDHLQGDEGMIQIEVQDSGIGIAKENLDRIFEPFTQADSSITRIFGGTGLGLAISKRITEGLNGSISVESQFGRGSVFTVRLPCKVSSDRSPARLTSEAIRIRKPETTSHSAVRVAEDLQGHRILVVDDGATNRKLICLMLRKAGAIVDCAENGEKALEALAERHYDLVLMDMQMPVMDGYTATRELRVRGSNVPVVALTAHAMRGDREKCLAAGCTEFLSKPVDRDALCRLVARFVSATEATVDLTTESSPQSLAASTNMDVPGSSQAAVAPVLESYVSTLPFDEEYHEIIQEFLDGLPQRFQEISRSISEGKLQDVASLAHSLKGSAGMSGFGAFAERVGPLETAARDGLAVEAERHTNELKLLSVRLEVASQVEVQVCQ